MAVHNDLPPMAREAIEEYLTIANYCVTTRKPNNGVYGYPAVLLLFSVVDALSNYAGHPAERIKEAALGFERADNTRIEQRAHADAFVALHTEWIDIDTNAQTMNKTLAALYGERLYSVSEFEKAYEVCRANNSLKLDQVEIVKQQQAAADQRAKAAREQRAAETRVFSEDEKENMSLEELRVAENREIQRRMQEAGERGGNGW